MLSLNELSDPNFRALFNARHPNTFNNFLTVAAPEQILQLGESMARDWKIANIIWMSREINRKRVLIDALAFMKLLL